MYKAIIFDLDGVICHTDQNHYRAWKKIADRLNIPFDETINQRLRGVSRMESLEILLEPYTGYLSQEEKIALAEEKNQLYRESLGELTPKDLSLDVRRTLEELKKMEIKVAIGSSSKNARYILERLGLSEAFDTVSDGNGLTRSKPDPEVFLRAAASLKIPPSCCLVVEDAKAGVDAALAAGMDCAALGDAIHHEGVTYKLERLTDLLDIFVEGGTTHGQD